MVTSYLMMKLMSSKGDVDLNKHYHDIYKQFRFININQTSNTCRICLNEGKISIFSSDYSSDIINALQIFANIHMNEADEYPKCLCKICYKFIRSAILFQKVSKKTENILKHQIKKVSSQDNSNFVCDSNEETEFIDTLSSCSKETVMEKIMVKPKLNRTTVSPKIQCKVCNKVVNRSYYKEHVTMHDPDHYKYVCDVCGKSFRLRCAYHNHSLRHRNDFPYKCQICPYKGRYAELLKTHMRTHTGDYRYMCTECPARFLFKSNLNSHMFKHKEPQFKCDACKKAFHTKILLKRHFDADHLGIKNNVCNMCGKAFGYRNAMMKHQRHVHKREKLSFARMPSYLKAENLNSQNKF